ncbi:hypothetical protein FRC02_004591 [Tulasnella sp. 418]|nr:hypothetical protein FRC02_004591 [Tulasnella sp. 418]
MDTLEGVQLLNVQSITIKQRISSIDWTLRIYTSGRAIGYAFNGNDRGGNDDQGRMENQGLSTAEKAGLDSIRPRAENAKYDSISQTSSSFCLPNTHLAVPDEISRWANDSKGQPMFWLNRMAGTSKTTIARTIARDLDEKGLLGASFFFSHDKEDHHSTSQLFPTIAYQLAYSRPSFQNQIVTAADPNACNAMMQTQLEKLIINPIKASTVDISSSVILNLDALDECVNENQIRQIVTSCW